jgi:hypothetical protein
MMISGGNLRFLVMSRLKIGKWAAPDAGTSYATSSIDNNCFISQGENGLFEIRLPCLNLQGATTPSVGIIESERRMTEEWRYAGIEK